MAREEVHGEVPPARPWDTYIKLCLKSLNLKAAFFFNSHLLRASPKKKISSIHGIDVKRQVSTISLKKYLSHFPGMVLTQAIYC